MTKSRKTGLTGTTLAKRAAHFLDDKRVYDISVLDVRKITYLTDYFVIGTADSTPQLAASRDHLIREMKRIGLAPVRVEGSDSSSWIVLDFGVFIAHIMLGTIRNFYGLDELWSDAKKARVNIKKVL